MLDLSNIEDGEEFKHAKSAKPDESDSVSANTAQMKQMAHGFERKTTNPIDDMERLLKEFDNKSKAAAEEGKQEDEDEENDGNLTRLVDKI